MQKSVKLSDKVVKVETSVPSISAAVRCLICDGHVTLTKEEDMMIRFSKPIIKVCPDCKAAVLEMKKKL